MMNGTMLNYGSFVVVDDSNLTSQLRTRIVNETYEEPEISLVRKMIRAGDRVLELGSGMGLVSLHIASICGSDNLRSIEANRHLIDVARTNGSINGFSFDIRHGFASTEAQSTVKSFYIDSNFLASSGSRHTAVGHAVTVPQIDVAEEANKFGATAIVADIEGAEEHALRGSYLSSISTIVVELHPTIISTQACERLLLQLSRQGFFIDVTLLRNTVIGLRRSIGQGPGQEVEGTASALVVEYLKALVLVETGQQSAACALLEKLCMRSPYVLEFHLRLAEIYLRHSEGSSALTVLERCSQESDLGDAGNVLLAQALLRAGRAVEARTILSRLSSVYTRRPQTKLLLARAALRMKEREEAELLASAAVETCPWNQEYRNFVEQVRQGINRSTKSAAVSVDPPIAIKRTVGMRELILHIGLPKTATSYLQRWMTVNAKPLIRGGIWVPQRQIFGHRLAVETISKVEVAAREDVAGIKRTSLEDSLTALQLAMRKTDARKFLVSSEYFYEANPEDVKQKLTADLGMQVRIILLLRRQDRLIESGYNQSVKAMGETGPIGVPRYLVNLDWFEFVSRWIRVFGKDNIEILNYDRLAPTGHVLAGFLGAIDPELTSTGRYEEFSDVKSLNESLPADLVEFKRIANSMGEFGLHDFLYRLMATGYKGPPFRMKEERARQIIALYEPSNERLAREVLGSVEPLFPPYGGSEEKAGVDLYGQLSIETLAKVVAFSIKESSETTRRMAAELNELRASLVRMQQ